MHTLGLLWEWSHTFGGSPIRAEFVRTSANTRLKALAGDKFHGPGWYDGGRVHVEALDVSADPHLRVSVFERDPRPRMLDLYSGLTSAERTQYRIELTAAHHAAVALALAINAGIPGAMHCYPTALGYEIYCKEFRNWDGTEAPLPLLLIVARACKHAPGFLGVRFDDHNYVTAVVCCQHPGRERA